MRRFVDSRKIEYPGGRARKQTAPVSDCSRPARWGGWWLHRTIFDFVFSQCLFVQVKVWLCGTSVGGMGDIFGSFMNAGRDFIGFYIIFCCR